MRGIEQARRREAQDLAADRAIHGARVALLEIGAAAAADQQAVARECQALVVEDVSDAPLRMAGGRAHFEVAVAEAHAVAVLEVAVGALRAARFRESDAAADALAQEPCARHMVRMDVGLERHHEEQVDLADQRDIAPRLLEHRIDEHRLARARVGEHVRVGGRLRIEELAKDEHRYSPAGAACDAVVLLARIRSTISKTPMPATIAATKTSAFT